MHDFEKCQRQNDSKRFKTLTFISVAMNKFPYSDREKNEWKIRCTQILIWRTWIWHVRNINNNPTHRSLPILFVVVSYFVEFIVIWVDWIGDENDINTYTVHQILLLKLYVVFYCCHCGSTVVVVFVSIVSWSTLNRTECRAFDRINYSRWFIWNSTNSQMKHAYTPKHRIISILVVFIGGSFYICSSRWWRKMAFHLVIIRLEMKDFLDGLFFAYFSFAFAMNKDVLRRWHVTISCK